MTKIITGFHSIEEFLHSKKYNELKDTQLLYSTVGPRVKNIIKLAISLGVATVKVEKKELDNKTSHLSPLLKNHKGVALILNSKDPSILKSMSLDEFIARIENKKKVSVLLLDGISDCYNMGSIIRSAEQFAIDAVIIPKRNSAGGDDAILKSSAGSASWMNIIEVTNLNACIENLKNIGFWIYAADMEGMSLYSLTFPDRVAIVMGSEGSGVSKLIKKNSDFIVSIPTYGKIDSLNVSVAAGVIMYELKKQIEFNT